MASDKCVEDIHEQLMEMRDEARRHDISADDLGQLLLLHGQELIEEGFLDETDHALQVRGTEGVQALLSD